MKAPKDKYELLQNPININKQIKNNEFSIIITQRIPYKPHKIIIKQMLLHPDIFIIEPMFAVNNFALTASRSNYK